MNGENVLDSVVGDEFSVCKWKVCSMWSVHASCTVMACAVKQLFYVFAYYWML